MTKMTGHIWFWAVTWPPTFKSLFRDLLFLFSLMINSTDLKNTLLPQGNHSSYSSCATCWNWRYWTEVCNCQLCYSRAHWSHSHIGRNHPRAHVPNNQLTRIQTGHSQTLPYWPSEVRSELLQKSYRAGSEVAQFSHPILTPTTSRRKYICIRPQILVWLAYPYTTNNTSIQWTPS